MTTAAANFPLAWRTRGAIRVLMSVNPVSKKKARNVSSAALAETVRSNMRKPKQNKSTKETRQFILNLILGGEVIVTQNQQVSSGIANGTIANVMDVVISDEDHVQWHEEPNFGGGYHSIEAKYVGGLLLRHAAGEWAGQQYVEVIAPDESSEPSPVDKQKQKQVPARRKDRATKDAVNGQS